MVELPTGTVTFLLTDIEGSTKLLQRVGQERYGEPRAEHERLLRRAWVERHGHEVDTQGDAFFVAFAHAAAAQAQRATLAYPWPAGAQAPVRMGLRTGGGELSHRHYVGLDVNRAARICAAGHGGQALFSQATRDQVAQELVEGQGIRDLGKRRLKDLPQREEIYQLTLPGPPTSFPPLKTLDAWPGYRVDLVAVLIISAVLLRLVGLALPSVTPVFPRDSWDDTRYSSGSLDSGRLRDRGGGQRLPPDAASRPDSARRPRTIPTHHGRSSLRASPVWRALFHVKGAPQ
jgi:class 3 adenylate cyclase